MKPLTSLCLADIISTHIREVSAETGVAEAAKKMADARISCLLIRTEGVLEGIVTERDMVRCLHQRTDPKASVGQLMSSPVITAPLELNIRSAYELLGQHQVRHLVALDAAGDVFGIASETDFRTHLGFEVFQTSRNLSAVMDSDPGWISPETPLVQVLERMTVEGADYMLALEDGVAVGILTERDTPKLLAQGVDVDTLRLADVMSQPIHSVGVGATVVEALSRMGRYGCRHMVVLGPGGRISGVISQHRLLERLGLEIIETAWREHDAVAAERASLEGRLSMLLDMTEVGVWEFDYPGDRYTWSASVCAMFGCSEQNLPRSSNDWLGWIHPEELGIALAAIRQAFTSDSIFEAECRIRHLKEGWVWARFRGRVVERGENRRALRAAGTVIDISAQRSSEHALQDERARLKTLFDTLPDLVWLKDKHGRYLSCNAVFARFLGTTEGSLVGRSNADFFPADRVQLTHEKDQAAITASSPLASEEWVSPSGSEKKVLLETIRTPMRDRDGCLIGVLGIARDVTHSRQVQTELAQRVSEMACLYEIFRETERSDQLVPEMLRRVAGLLSGGVRFPAAATVSIFFDGETFGMPEIGVCLSLLNVPFETIYGKGYIKISYRNDPASAAAPEFVTEERAFVEAVAERVASAIARITESAALRDREQVFSAIVGQARDGISLVDPESLEFVEFNDAACSGLGYCREEFAELDLADVQATLTREELRARVGELLISGGGEFKVEHLSKAGDIQLTRVSARVVIVHARPYLALIWSDITAQEQVENRMNALRERFQRAFQSSPVAASITHFGDGEFVDVNDKYIRDFGWERDELLGNTAVDVGLWADVEERQHWLEAMLRDNGVIDYAVRWFDRKHRERYVSISSQLIDINDESHVLSYVVDITDRRQAEQALRESERRFRSLFEEIPSIAVQGYDERRRVVFWNAASERLYGYSEAEALGNVLDDLIVPEAMRAEVAKLHSAWLAHGAAIPAGELDLLHKDGSLIPVFSSHALLERPDGQREMYCVDVDLTSLRRAEKKLRESEAHYRSMISALAEGVILFDIDSTILNCNPRAEALLGRSAESMIGQVAFERDWGMTREDGSPLPLEVSPLADVLKSGVPTKDYIAGYRHPEGKRLWLSINCSAVGFSEAGKSLAAVVSIVDITEKRNAEESVRKLSLAVEQSPNAILITDRKARIEYVNKAFERISGYARDEVLGQTPKLWQSAETPAKTHVALRAAMKAGQPWRGEFVNRSKDGSLHIDFSHVSPVRQADGRVTHYLAIQEDITERKRIGVELDRHRHHLQEMVHERTAELEEANRRLSISDLRLNAMFAMSQRAADLAEQDLLKLAVDESARLTGSRCAYLVLLGGSEGGLEGAAGLQIWTAANGQHHISTGTAGVIFDSPMDHPLIDNEPSCAFPAGALHRMVHHHMRVPVMEAGQVCMLLGVGDKADDYDESDRRELQLIGDDLWRIVMRRRAEKALEAARDAAEAASRSKSAFLANMSHEIRTPMNAIIGLTHLLQREVIDTRQLDHLRKVSNSARHLLAIINDVLDISKIEAEKVVLDASDFRLSSVFDNVASMLADKVAEKGLLMKVVLAADVPDALHGDALRLGQILLNFASNAVKFTAQGTVTLFGSVAARDASGILLRCEIVDTGVGIAEAAQSRLFAAFEQADSSTTRQFGGTGLGLAINKRLAMLMGGEVGLKSQPGVGSTFWFTARLAAAVDSSKMLMVEPSLSAELLEKALFENHAGAHILLVEDNPVNREVALSLMADLGFSIDCAENGSDAVDLARRNEYDLILMDMQMPIMDGVEAAAAIRALPERATVPIVALTANAFDDDRRRCLQAGMNDHVAKPVEPATLFAALRRWLPKRMAKLGSEPLRGMSIRAAVPGEMPGDGNSASDFEEMADRLRLLSGIDLDAGLHRFRGRAVSYSRLLHMFAEGHGKDVERLHEMVAHGDSEAAQRMAHSLKGAAGMLSATAVQEAAAQLETLLRNPQAAGDLQRVEVAVTTIGAVLQPLLDAIGSTAPVADSATAPTPPEVRRMLVQLNAYLVEDDISANTFCQQSQPDLHAAFGDACNRLLQEVAAFDYEAARLSIDHLLQKLAAESSE